MLNSFESASSDARRVAMDSYKDYTVGSLSELINNTDISVIQTRPTDFAAILLSLKNTIAKFYQDKKMRLQKINSMIVKNAQQAAKSTLLTLYGKK